MSQRELFTQWIRTYNPLLPPKQTWHSSASHQPSIGEKFTESSWKHLHGYVVTSIEVKKNAVMTLTAICDPPNDEGVIYHFALTKDGEWVSSDTKDSGFLYAAYQIYWGQAFTEI